MTSKSTRDVMRRPTLVTYGSDQQPRLLPLLESKMEEASDAGDDKSQSHDDDDVDSCEDQESLVADYDTDLDVAGQQFNAFSAVF